MPNMFNSPKTPAPPPLPTPVAMPVAAGPNNANQAAIAAQSLAITQSQSGRNSTDLVKGNSATLG